MSTISPDNGHRTLNNRAWINEAMHLRYDKKVHGKQVSKRINIPRTTLQSLFRRFTRSGLNWPVPEHISPEQLEQLARAFAYALNQWSALKYYAGDSWAEADNNIAENALRTVSLGRKNYLLFGSDHGGDRGAQLYGIIGSCRLNGIDPERYLRHVLSVIADWPVSRVGELLPWRVTLPGE
ncbi:transposase domain-containing protein [Klebsiella grimontii]|uniref:transposase domain-containing protein n=1 Tax=Klebsiella grimontii TaxID=2058152 RepID=UPI002ADE6861|nr:transposase domain-containing protein [Klebsiella grimontii]